MKPLALILTSIVAAAATAYLIVEFRTPASAASGPVSAEQPTDDLVQRIAALESELGSLRGRVADAAAGASGRTALPELSAADVDAALQRLLARDPEALAGLGGIEAREATLDGAADGPFDAAALFDQLHTGEMSWEDMQAIWSSKTPEQQDALIARYEAWAAGYPNDPNAQNELGEAYVHRLMNADMAGMMVYGQKAEKQFDTALELDDHHWRARFNKAMSLSNQPAFLGRRPEAIRHFETLLSQQETAPQAPEHAQTYLFLGNLHAQAGDEDKAREVWERGLGRFPGSAELRQRIGR